MSNSKLVAQGTPNEIKAQHTGELFELKTDTPQEAFNALQAELDPWRITIFGRALHILLDDPKHDAENVKSILKKASLNFEDLHTIPFSLEDAFINIVDGHQSGENADHQENDKRKSHE
jgi:ABC-type multidrug transport system ATPase subunit